MKRLAILIAILIFLILNGIGLYLFLRNREDPSTLTLYGNVDVRQVDISFRIAGRVAELFYEEGDVVPENSLMAVLDKTPYDSQLKEAKAQLKSVKANLNNAEILLRRREEAVVIGGVSQEDVDNARASVKELRASYKGAEAAVQVAMDNLIYTEVYAPTEGIILSRIREPGSVVNPTEPVYNLSVTNPVWIRAYVDEPALGDIYYGQKATINTDSGQKYRGQIGFISPMAEFTPKSVETAKLRTDLVYRLRIYADNPDRFLKQGMPVTVQLRKKGE